MKVQLTHHALMRSKERNILPAKIRRVVREALGDIAYPEVVLEIFREGITVVYDKATGDVLTAFKGQRIGWYKWIETEELRKQHRLQIETKNKRRKRRQQSNRRK